MSELELLKYAREEISSLRKANEKQEIRLSAIDDMLSLVHAKPGINNSQGMMSPDILFEIERYLAKAKEPQVVT